MFLNQSQQWKETSLHEHKLVEAHFQDRDYIGLSLESPLSYQQLKVKEEDLKSMIQQLCPKLNVDKQKIHIFPELFVS